MAKKTTIDLIIKTFRELGGNVSDVLGKRSNVSFLGLGDNVEPFLDKNLNTEALGVLSQSKAVDEVKNSVSFAVGEKLNDIQANNLLINLNKMKEFYMPAPVTNITDLATGTRDLDAQGLASVRDDLPPPGSRGGPDDIAAPVQSAEETIKNLEKQDAGLAAQFKKMLDDGTMSVAGKSKTTPFDEAVEYNARPEDVVQNLVDQKFGVGYFDNIGSTPEQRGSAREFLVEALKKENPNQTNFADIIEEVDVKYITEGGGGLAGDPLTLVNKYFGPRIAEMVPSGASSEEIAIFTERVLNNVVDANGLRPTDPRFDRLTARIIEDFARGGLAKILEV